jgi:hypothetical protein
MPTKSISKSSQNPLPILICGKIEKNCSPATPYLNSQSLRTWVNWSNRTEIYACVSIGQSWWHLERQCEWDQDIWWWDIKRWFSGLGVSTQWPLQVTMLDMELGLNLWIECWWRAMIPAFSDCMPLSNQSCCEYLTRADPLLSWSTFNHPFLLWFCLGRSFGYVWQPAQWHLH